MSEPQINRGPAVKAVTKYGLARLGIFLVLTALIHLAAVALDAPVPIIFSAMLALFVAMPLSMLIFTRWRVEATEALAELSEQRKARRNWVQRELNDRT